MMEYRSLGSSEIRVSLLGLGTVKLGRNRQVKYPRPFDLPDDATVSGLLACARDLGINLIDTAPAYGSSEARLGRLLPGRREDWVLCSKVGEEFEGGRSRFDFSPEHTRLSVERSLRRLGTDYLDVVLIHSDGNDLEILERHGTLDALAELRQRGLVRAAGISHKTVEGGQRAVELGAQVIMATLNPNEREQLPVIAQAAARGCGVLVKKALASGQAGSDSLTFAAAVTGVCALVVGTIDTGHLRANAAALGARAH